MILVKDISVWLHCSVLRFSMSLTAQIRALHCTSTSCFTFLFDILKITKLMKKFLKKGHTRYFPGDFFALTGRLGDLKKNLEIPGKTGRVGKNNKINEKL